MSKVIIYGGGTFSPVRNHLSLCAPSFGTTAKYMGQYLSVKYNMDVEVVLTKMADSTSKIITNKDISIDIDRRLNDPSTKCIIMSAALCDYDVVDPDSGWHGDRLKTSEGNVTLELSPSDKLIDNIRKKRPDIFLVGFKTTTNKSAEDQFSIALKMMKRSKCNLVLANDTVTRHNMIITPEETMYGEGDRDSTIKELCEMIHLRYNLSYDRTIHKVTDNISMSTTPDTFQEVIRYLVDNGGFIENNGNGFTPSHFCYKNRPNGFLCSQRKANHNKVFTEGLAQVYWEDDNIYVEGSRKASVGARSQRILLESYDEYDCIVHTHNPLKTTSSINTVEQKPFQCGSIECGMNTLQGVQDYKGIKAVYINKHGANILFKSTDNPLDIIKFIKDNLVLGEKVM